LIAEAYDLLKRLGWLSNPELGHIFTQWSKSPELEGFLMEITAQIFAVKDPESGNDLLDMIQDAAAQKGTGKWTTESAFEYGVSVPAITAGVDARIMSSAKEFRVMQAKATPLQVDDIPVDRNELLHDVRDALELSMLNAYAQGLQLLTEASKAEGWNLNISEICRIWRGGCIIRSAMTEWYQKAFAGDRDAGLALRERFNKERQINWRRTVALGALRGIPLPAMSSALWYYDSYRTERLPQNLIQAQRDFFGAHEFERTDKEGKFHAKWQ
jgi:6-phosphogluconate dehydrogenase